MKSLSAILLALMLTFTGQSMAVARGMSGPDGKMVICSGHGPVVVYVDAQGQPVSPPQICPDAALSLIQSAFDAPPQDQVRSMSQLKFGWGHLVKTNARINPTPQARGPPI